MIFILLLVSYVNLSLCDFELKYAAVVYRHGDRTPVNPYPTDPWRNESLWPVKFGELTNIGKRQHYALGKWLRKRFVNYLSNEFDPKQLYVRSTDVDRTLMSAQANLAGMYPPKGDSIWNSKLLWQPIPIHTEPEKEDVILASKKHCSAYDIEKKYLLESRAYKKRLSQYQNLMNYLSAHTGTVIKDYIDIEYIYNTLYIENLYNFQLPNWTQSVYPKQMIEPACYSFTTSTATPKLARLKVGPLLKHIVWEIYNCSFSDFKLSIFSAHDDTIGNILNAMGMFDGRCPVYTATILFEVFYNNATSANFIRISYRNSTEIVEPHILNIPYCGQECPLERFIKLYDNLITVNWEYECREQFPAVLGLSFFIGLSIFATIYVIHKIIFIQMMKRYRIFTESGTNYKVLSLTSVGNEKKIKTLCNTS